MLSGEPAGGKPKETPTTVMQEMTSLLNQTADELSRVQDEGSAPRCKTCLPLVRVFRDRVPRQAAKGLPAAAAGQPGATER
jgi:hypothetical protein